MHEVSGDELTTGTGHRAKALIVEIVRYSLPGDSSKTRLDLADLCGVNIAKGDLEAITTNIVRGIGSAKLAEVEQPDGLMDKTPPRAVENGEVLSRSCVTILESSAGE